MIGASYVIYFYYNLKVNKILEAVNLLSKLHLGQFVQWIFNEMLFDLELLERVLTGLVVTLTQHNESQNSLVRISS